MYHTGGYYDEGRGQFRWRTKNLAHETPWNGAWDAGEPHISQSNCVGARYTNALLKDMNCVHVKHYMCEVSRGKLVVVLLKKNSKSNTYKIC